MDPPARVLSHADEVYSNESDSENSSAPLKRGSTQKYLLPKTSRNNSARRLRAEKKYRRTLPGGVWNQQASCKVASFRNNDCYMKRNSRLSVALHALVQMALRRGQPATSEQLADCLMTNPVVVRRTMAGLREYGLVRSTPGHGGGWMLSCDAETITLRQVYEALGESMLAGVERAESPGCLLEQAISGLVNDFRMEAEALLLLRLGQETLGDLKRAVKRLMRKYNIRSMPHAA